MTIYKKLKKCSTVELPKITKKLKMIIGIALVVDELNKGPRLIFRYPENAIPSQLTNHTKLLKYHRDFLDLR